jgi:hypothetical protein
VYNGVSSFGILDISDAIDLSSDAGTSQVKITTVLVATAPFTNSDGTTKFRHGGRIAVAGKPYRVDRASPEDDGRLTRVYLAGAA